MIKKEIKLNIIKQSDDIRLATSKLEKARQKILFIIDDNGKTIGSITDGDIRRGISKGISLKTKVSNLMNTNPKLMKIGVSNSEISMFLRENKISQVGLIDESGILQQIKSQQNLKHPKTLSNVVLIMAGGEGKRLRPLTNDIPKPMIKVGGRPVLETIILNCSQQGLKKFYISLNYKGESIEKYFGDGMKWGVSINYLKEKKKLGTAGIIKELRDVKEDILVINGDILTTTDFNKIINFHKTKKSFATMITKKYETVIPYGVVEVKQDVIINIKEKPLLKYNINAGIYIINPTVFKNLNSNEFLDMTELFNLLISNKKKTFIYEIDDYWLDIGRLEDLQKAKYEYNLFFDF